MKMTRIVTFLCVLSFLAGASAWALTVPQSDQANTPGQASSGLSTADTSSSTADSHVP